MMSNLLHPNVAAAFLMFLAVGAIAGTLFAAEGAGGQSGACTACGTSPAAVMTDEEKTAAEKVRAAGVAFLTAKDLSERIQSGRPPVLVDVLDPSSYLEHHLKGAINIPLKDIATVAPKVLPDKNAEIVVYCGGFQCGASLKAAATLKQMGYTRISDYKGGLKDWTTRGLPLEGTGIAAK